MHQHISKAEIEIALWMSLQSGPNDMQVAEYAVAQKTIPMFACFALNSILCDRTLTSSKYMSVWNNLLALGFLLTQESENLVKIWPNGSHIKMTTHWDSFFDFVSSLGPPGSSLMEVQRVEGRLVRFGLEGPTEGSGGGDLVRTWHRLMCRTLAEVMSLILEWQRLRR